MESHFDVLAKALAIAGDLPRGAALRRVCGALFATALTSWVGTGCGGVSQVVPRPPSGTSSLPGSGNRAPADEGDGDQGGGNQGGGNQGNQGGGNPSPG